MSRVIAAAMAALTLGTGAADVAAREGSQFKDAVRGRGGVVASESRLAAREGIKTLDAGGNAVDAAVATVFAVGVVRPEMCGIGGGGFLVYRGANGKVATLDFRERAPSVYEFTPGIGTGPALAFGTGHGTVGVPGTVAGMAAAFERFGTKSLSDTIAGAEALARNGFPVSRDLSYWMGTQQPRLELFPAAATTYLDKGLTPYKQGQRLVLADYAKSLRRIAEHGVDGFYKGAIAKAIAADMRRSGTYPGGRGTMTAKDLAEYRAIWRKPLRGKYRDHEVIAMPAPTSGGIATLEILNLLEGFDVRAAGQSSADHLHLMAESQKIAWADRNEYVGDPDFVDVPAATLTSDAYADVRRREIDMARARSYDPGTEPGSHTTHVSVIDRRGNAVSVTCTIEQPFGSAVVVPGTGFLLNNQLTDFGEPGTANEPKPNKRPRSSTSPTIVVRNGKPVMAVGGAGGPMIVMGVVNAIVGMVDFQLDVARAVDAERVDARGYPGAGELSLGLEDARIPGDVLAELEQRGHELIRAGEYADAPLVQAVGIDPRTCDRVATSDPRNQRASGDEEGRGALAQEGIKRRCPARSARRGCCKRRGRVD